MPERRRECGHTALQPAGECGLCDVDWLIQNSIGNSENRSRENLTQQRRDFAARLAAMKHEAGELGLFRTLQAMDEATRACSYEIADLLTGKQADVAAKREARP